MNSIPTIYPTEWKDYELIDSGQGAKLERFGTYVISRPDPRAIWKRNASEDLWANVDAQYVRSSKETGDWNIKREPPKDWHISYKGLVFALKPTSFKHIGVFPEQAVNWDWITEKLEGKKATVLNLFAYTGGATLASAKAGARVTHVDSSAGAIGWAKENVLASGLEASPIRYIQEDAYKFVAREGRRSNTYDAIILDPPRFGRGDKGEMWKIEDDLPKMLEALKTILSPEPLFILINAYTADLSSIVLSHLMTDLTKTLGGTVTHGELTLKDTTSGRLLPNGIFGRWEK